MGRSRQTRHDLNDGDPEARSFVYLPGDFRGLFALSKEFDLRWQLPGPLHHHPSAISLIEDVAFSSAAAACYVCVIELACSISLSRYS